MNHRNYIIVLGTERIFWQNRSNNMLCWYICRVSQVFKVNSAKTVRITDKQLIKLLLLMIAFVTVILFIRTMVSPPHTIVGRTANNLKTDICPTDWWDHSFSIRKCSLNLTSVKTFLIIDQYIYLKVKTCP